ncbi:MAG: HPr family phosphocarrier protein [Ruminococcus sp.]|nr:HPr family phosphocarrier protein [Ruminococcus sp.]
MKTFEYTIKDELGIHARPAGVLVKTAKSLDSEITITAREKSVSAVKLMAVMSMGIKGGDTVRVTIDGGDEERSERVMKEFFEKNL